MRGHSVMTSQHVHVHSLVLVAAEADLLAVLAALPPACSYFELEQQEYARKGINLSVEAWLVKLMVGAIDPEYDEQDEGGPAPTQQQQQYQQQPGYGQPPAGYGYPPPQAGYGQPPGGYPPAAHPHYPQQQQPQFAYSPPQQQYGGNYGPAAGAPPGYPASYPQHHQQPQKPKKGFFDKLFG